MVHRSSLVEKLLEAEVANKRVMELTRRLSSINQEIADVKKELVTLRSRAGNGALLRAATRH